jgi:hypothetical protein
MSFLNNKDKGFLIVIIINVFQYYLIIKPLKFLFLVFFTNDNKDYHYFPFY